MLPEIPEVHLNFLPQVYRNVFSLTKRLVSDLFDKNEPSLQQVFIIAETVVLQSHNHFDKCIHDNWEQGHSKDLNERTDDFLSDAERVQISIPNGWQGG